MYETLFYAALHRQKTLNLREVPTERIAFHARTGWRHPLAGARPGLIVLAKIG